ncbi:hypothetical protein ACKVV7_011486, partial [Pyricularia oryzae]
MSQTSPKLKRISRVFADGGGLWKYLVRACAAIKKRTHRHDPDVEKACDAKAELPELFAEMLPMEPPNSLGP